MPKLWLPPKVWFHGSQSHSTGGSSPRNAKTVRSISWLEQSMRCVVTTPFGLPVEPDVNKTLAIVSGVTRECASSTAAEGEASANSWNEVERSDAGGVTVTSSVHESRTSESGSSKAAPSAANTREGSNRCQRYLSVVSSADASEYEGAMGA